VTTRNTPRRPLTELQQAILDVLWTAGPGTADSIREALAPRHRLKDSSVRTLLRRLEARGFVRHRTAGKLFRTSVAARAVQQIIDRFWSGSAEQFLVGMVDEEVLTPDEIRKLARKVRKAR
jgi:predicted transcriptional regulator